VNGWRIIKRRALIGLLGEPNPNLAEEERS
jgi:hypothetical protein